MTLIPSIKKYLTTKILIIYMSIVISMTAYPDTLKDLEEIREILERKTGKELTRSHIIRDMVTNFKQMLKDGNIEIIESNGGDGENCIIS